MKKIIIPAILSNKAYEIIAHWLNEDQVIRNLNAYIDQYKLTVEMIDDDDPRSSIDILSDTLSKFPDKNKLDFFAQIVDAGYIYSDHTDYAFLEDLVDKYDYDSIQKELLSELSVFGTGAVSQREEFARRLEKEHKNSKLEWDNSFSQFRLGFYSDAGEDLRKSMEFLLDDILDNDKPLEKQIKGNNEDKLKSPIGKFLAKNKKDKFLINYFVDIVVHTLKILNNDFKHGEPNKLTDKDIRMILNQCFLIMQYMMDVSENGV